MSDGHCHDVQPEPIRLGYCPMLAALICKSEHPQRDSECIEATGSDVRCPHVQPDHIKEGYCPRLPGVRMPATYINHYAANGGVVVPQFGGACSVFTESHTTQHLVPRMLLQLGSCWKPCQGICACLLHRLRRMSLGPTTKRIHCMRKTDQAVRQQAHSLSRLCSSCHDVEVISVHNWDGSGLTQSMAYVCRHGSRDRQDGH